MNVDVLSKMVKLEVNKSEDMMEITNQLVLEPQV